MAGVFITYRQIDADQCRQVRAFAERLRGCGIEVVFDQFLLEAKPGGPSEGWDKWSSDRVLEAEHVIIIGSESWFQCFDKKQQPGSGLGAACEADDLRHRIYQSNGIVDDIRVVLFADADAKHISPKLVRYHRFQAERDFQEVVRWLMGDLPLSSEANAAFVSTSIPNNLPRLQPFHGRKVELDMIRSAIDPESKSWGALIYGRGGIGKTSLAVRGAYNCRPGAFQRIAFVSVKDREMEDDGVHTVGNFLVPGFLEMLNELARELGQPDIAKAPEDQRVRLLETALRGARVLLILDNLESLPEHDRHQLLGLLKRLPHGCKAILTCRRRIGSSANDIPLDKLDQRAALATLADLEQHIPLLKEISNEERCRLYRDTDGNPLLLRWFAGQLGRGSCTNFQHALRFLRSCPLDKDPLEFIFGELANDLTIEEVRVLAALTHFTHKVKVADIASVAEISEPAAETALRVLFNCSLVVIDQTEQQYLLISLVDEFVRKVFPHGVTKTGSRLAILVFELINEYGFERHDHFQRIEDAWPMLSAALRIFCEGENQQLQIVCEATRIFGAFTGRWDEGLCVLLIAEKSAVAAGDFSNAVRRVSDAGWIYFERGEKDALAGCVTRAIGHSKSLPTDDPALAVGSRLMGHHYMLAADYDAAAAAFETAVDFDTSRVVEDFGTALNLNSLAEAKRAAGRLDEAERDFHRAANIFEKVGDDEGFAISTGLLAVIAFQRGDWSLAENLSRKALVSSENVGRKDLIGVNCVRLVKSLIRQGRGPEGHADAKRAVDIFTALRARDLDDARQVFRESEGRH